MVAQFDLGIVVWGKGLVEGYFVRWSKLFWIDIRLQDESNNARSHHIHEEASTSHISMTTNEDPQTRDYQHGHCAEGGQAEQVVLLKNLNHNAYRVAIVKRAMSAQYDGDVMPLNHPYDFNERLELECSIFVASRHHTTSTKSAEMIC